MATPRSSVRRVEPADLPRWLSLRLALWPDTEPERHRAEMAEILEQPRRCTALVVDLGGQLVAFAEVSLRRWAEGCESSPVGYLEGWYVTPEHRGHGLGAELIVACERWARDRGCGEMASDTEADNSTSLEIHQHLGYAPVCTAVHLRKRL